MIRVRALLLSVSVAAVGLVFPAAVNAPLACAATADSAALVVDTGGSVTRYCVEIPHSGTDGIGLIKLASQQYALSYNLGFGGAAVCALNGVGVTSSSDCFADMPDFWGYYIGNGSGGWSWSGTGAGSISVDPGDVQGWSWGAGKDGSSHPQPPATDYEDVCTVKQSSGGSGGDGDGDKNGSGDGSGNGANSGNDPGSQDPGANDNSNNTVNGDADPTSNADQGDDDRETGAADGGTGEGSAREAGSTSTEPTGGEQPAAEPPEAGMVPIVDASPIAAASGTDLPSSGPPAAALIVLAAAIALVAAGILVTRRPRGKHARK